MSPDGSQFLYIYGFCGIFFDVCIYSNIRLDNSLDL